MLWARNLRETASAAKRKPAERELAIRTPENIKRLFHTFIGNPRQSERRNALTLKMSGRTVR
jgi:cell wall assembly regulator SMI1